MNIRQSSVLLATVTAFAVLCFPSIGQATLGDELAMEKFVVADAPALSTHEMGELRGGFMDPTGLLYNFTVNVQTALNGAQIFTRSIVVAPDLNGQLQATATANLIAQNIPSNLLVNLIGNGQGVNITNAISAANAETAAAATTASAQTTAATATPVVTASTAVTPVAPAIPAVTTTSVVPAGFTTAQNVTTILNQTASGIPSSIIINNVSNRSISQSINLSLTLPNPAAIQQYVQNTVHAAMMTQQNALHSLGL